MSERGTRRPCVVQDKVRKEPSCYIMLRNSWMPVVLVPVPVLAFHVMRFDFWCVQQTYHTYRHAYEYSYWHTMNKSESDHYHTRYCCCFVLLV